jgi:hypothetical protein
MVTPMRYRRYERGTDLPGSVSLIRTGPIGWVWFGMQGIVLTGVLFLWPSLTLYINRAQLWAWFVFPPVQILMWVWIYWTVRDYQRMNAPKRYVKKF